MQQKVGSIALSGFVAETSSTFTAAFPCLQKVLLEQVPTLV